MVYLGIIFVLYILFISVQFRAYRQFVLQKQLELNVLTSDFNVLNDKQKKVSGELKDLEDKMAEQFFFYELIRDIAPILNKNELFNVFFEEMKTLGEIEKVIPSGKSLPQGWYEFELDKDQGDPIHIKTKSKKIVEYLPSFIKLLSLCVERVNLYEKLQQLSIHDSLTKCYNRRYFMVRFIEEFERARQFKLNLALLMIDVDHFKKINDNHGHLVGDVVLREVVKLIKENIREIDFVARYGGEEFSLVLLDTDKTGALMVGERIVACMNKAKIKAFDEDLHVTVSIGVAAFPQNTLHSDVLIETADKALYTAKASGRNQVGWF